MKSTVTTVPTVPSLREDKSSPLGYGGEPPPTLMLSYPEMGEGRREMDDPPDMHIRASEAGPAIRFVVNGRPRPQPRPRYAGGRRPVGIVDKGIALWKAAVTRAASEAGRAHGSPPWLGQGVQVDLEFTFAASEAGRWGRLHTSTPDIDNLGKLAMDAMADARLLPRGDANVAVGLWRKVWGRSAGVVVTVRPATAAPAAPQGGGRPEGATPGWLEG